MKKSDIDAIEKKALANVPRFIWSLAGISIIFTLLLMFNGINAGTFLNNYMEIYIEERRSDVRSRKDLELRIIELEKLAHKAHIKKL